MKRPAMTMIKGLRIVRVLTKFFDTKLKHCWITSIWQQLQQNGALPKFLVGYFTD